MLKWQVIICAINKCCWIVVAADGELKLSLFLQVMQATNVSPNIMVAWLIKERRVHLTTYGNLRNWFVQYWAFMLKYEFAQLGSNGDEMIFDEENLHPIINVDKTKMSLNGSKTKRAAGRPSHFTTPTSQCPVSQWKGYC
jgi:hypothetical protein